MDQTGHRSETERALERHVKVTAGALRIPALALCDVDRTGEQLMELGAAPLRVGPADFAAQRIEAIDVADQPRRVLPAALARPASA